MTLLTLCDKITVMDETNRWAQILGESLVADENGEVKLDLKTPQSTFGVVVLLLDAVETYYVADEVAQAEGQLLALLRQASSVVDDAYFYAIDGEGE